MNVDLVLLLGDITSFGGADDMRRVIDAVRDHGSAVFAVPGNCDLPDAAAWLDDSGISLHRRCVVRGNVALLGIGLSLPCPDPTPGEVSDGQFAQYLQETAEQIPAGHPLVVVAHEPPYNTAADIAHTGQHVGSRALRAFLVSVQPAVCLCGHIHEGAGIDHVGSVTVANPGPLWHGAYVRLDTAADVCECRLLRC